MPTVIFVLPDGRREAFDAPAGTTAMEVATRHFVPGIVGECGGACTCATCHVHVDEAWLARLLPADPPEDGMLEAASGRDGRSRLSCQIELSQALDGLVLHVPRDEG